MNRSPTVEAGKRLVRILVVDDNAALVDLLKEGLRRNQAFTVEGAQDGSEGLTKVGTFSPHLLIIGLRMPGVDGAQVCRKLKANPSTQSIKVLAITGNPEQTAHEGILEAGADGFLKKPFRLAELEAEVTRLVGTLQG